MIKVMNSLERVLAALNLEKVDKVPYVELHVDRELVCRLLDRTEPTGRRIETFPGFYPEGFGFAGGEWYTRSNVETEPRLFA